MKIHHFLVHTESFLLMQAIFAIATLTVFCFILVSPKVDADLRNNDGRVAGVMISTYTDLDFTLSCNNRRHTATDYALFDQNEYVIEITPKSLSEGTLIVDLVNIKNLGSDFAANLTLDTQIVGMASDSINVNIISSDGYRKKIYDSLEGSIPYTFSVAAESFEDLRIEYEAPITINFPFTIKLSFSY